MYINVFSGCQNWRRGALMDHLGKENSAHHRAVSASQSGSLSDKLLTPAKLRKSVIAALEAAFHVAKMEQPNSHYSALIDLLRHRGDPDVLNLQTGDNATYDSDQTFAGLLDSINHVLSAEMSIKIQYSPFLGVGMDESTDISHEKHVLFVVRYFDTSKSKIITEYWRVEKIKDGTAETLFDTYSELLKSCGIEVRKVCTYYQYCRNELYFR